MIAGLSNSQQYCTQSREASKQYEVFFDPSRAGHMINYRWGSICTPSAFSVSSKASRSSTREDYDYGRFAWIMDPDGNRIEWWEPLPKKKQG
jgi:hypothetical protein